MVMQYDVMQFFQYYNSFYSRITITDEAEGGQENKGNLELPESLLQGVSKIDKVIIINGSSRLTIR